MLDAKNVIIQTDRLNLRTWTSADVPLLSKINQDKNVMEFFPALQDSKTTQQKIQRYNLDIEETNFGLFATEIRASGDFIGFIGLNRTTFKSFFTPCIEIGWRLAFEHWGNGYATEGARACLQYGFRELKLSEVYSFTAVSNFRSENVMKKIGMTKIGEFDHPKLPEKHWLQKHVLYKIKVL